MKSIRRRLTQRLVLGWTLLLLLGSVVAYLVTWNALTRQFDEGLRTKAIALMSAVEQDAGHVTVDTSDEIVRDFDRDRHAYFQVWNSDGSVVARSPSLGEAGLPLRCNTVQHPEFSNVELPGGIRARAAGMRFRLLPANDNRDSQAVAEALLVVATDRRSLDQSLATLALVLAGSSLLVLSMTATMVPWLLRREMAPLARLADQAQRISADSLAGRFPTDGMPEELTPISARLNDLLQRLQTSFERERRFSDDLAHEFRTPIAELRSLAELSLKWPEARNAETDRHVLGVALQMESIINRLLAMARSDRTGAAIEVRRVELATLVSDACAPFQVRAEARRLSLRVNVPTAQEIGTDPVLLRAIVTNLVDNAVEYSPSGGSVQIRGEVENGTFALGFTNPAGQLSPEDIPHLFERFWRKDAARSGSEHSGLGLSLARAFATSLGYSLTARLNDDASFTVTLSGPTRPERPAQPASPSRIPHQDDNS